MTEPPPDGEHDALEAPGGAHDALEAPDGLVDLSRTVAAAPFAVLALRGDGWSLAGAAVDADGAPPRAVSLTFRAVGPTGHDRVVIVTSCGADADVTAIGREAAVALAYEVWQREQSWKAREAGAEGFVEAVRAAALELDPERASDTPSTPGQRAGWRSGELMGVVEPPPHVTASAGPDGAVVLAVTGLPRVELPTLADSLVRLAPENPVTAQLEFEHRLHLAQLWVDGTPDRRPTRRGP